MVCVDWQFPVVAVENDMPIINPVTGLQHGQLKVVLAMGSLEQISAYQRTKAGSASAISVADRPTNYLERCLFSCSCLYVSESNFFIYFYRAVIAREMLQFVKTVLTKYTYFRRFNLDFVICMV